MNQVTLSPDWPHVLYEATLPDGRIAHIVPLTFGRARINVGRDIATGYDDLW